jgi:DNA-binding SARP family transcriptional activator/TolB-like protein
VLALLACILRRAPEPLPRAELAALLWPDRSTTHAKQSLRQALAELRGVLGESIITDSESVCMDPDACRFDITVFEEAVRLERWEEAAQVWGGDFLHGLDAVAGEAWVAWLLEERTRLRAQAATVFENLLAIAERRVVRRAAVGWAQMWCDVAPREERACGARIGALVHTGRPVDAAVCYESFVRRVHSESHATPSAEFTALRKTFAANQSAPVDKVVVRGALTLSGLAQLTVDARAVAEAATVIDPPIPSALLQVVSGVTSYDFRSSTQELVDHGILRLDDGGRFEYTSQANRDLIFRVIAGDRRLALQRTVAEKTQTPIPPSAPRASIRLPWPRLPVRPVTLLTGVAATVILVAGINWAARVATAGSVQLAAGSTVLLADYRDALDPGLADALNAAANVGLKQSRHVAVVTPEPSQPSTADQAAARARAVARREGITRIIAFDVRRTDSVLQVAARLIDGSSGQVLGEETVDTRRVRLVDDLDRLLRKVRVALGEAEQVVRDSSRPLRDVASPSIDALSAYAEGVSNWGNNRPEEAVSAWTRALERDSTFALAELALANDAFSRDDHAAGERWARRAVEHADRLDALDALRARHMVAMRDARFDEATMLAVEIARRAPSANAWLDVASVHFAAGRCNETVSALDQSLALDSANTRARLLLVACALEQGNAPLALRSLDIVGRSRDSALSSAQYSRYRGLALTRAGRLDEADSAFQNMLRSAARVDSASAWRWRAQLAMLRGRYAEALPALHEATRLYRRDGQPADLFSNLILETSAFIAIGGRTRASELIDEAYAVAASQGISAVGYFQLGHLMARIGRINGAREALRLASLRADTGLAADRWALRLLTASVLLVERDGVAALETIDVPNAPMVLRPYRLAIAADANALAGRPRRRNPRSGDGRNPHTGLPVDDLRPGFRRRVSGQGLFLFAHVESDSARARE